MLERVEISKRQDECGTNKLEKKMSLRQNDGKRMQDLTAQLLKLRQKEDKSEKASKPEEAKRNSQ